MTKLLGILSRREPFRRQRKANDFHHLMVMGLLVLVGDYQSSGVMKFGTMYDV